MEQNTGCTNTELLKNKAILVRLCRKKLNRNRTDKVLSSELQLSKNVTENGAIRVNKSLLPKSCTDEYSAVLTQASTYFYRVTLPWDDKNFRLLSIDLYKEFTKEMKHYNQRFRQAVDRFVADFAASVNQMKDVLGEAFDANDYSEYLDTEGAVKTDSLYEKFSLEVEFGTISDGDDIRASLTEADREAITQHITEQNTKKFTKAQEHIITSLHDCIMAIHERLSKDENIFRDTLISNLKDLCDLIPKLNIANNPAITQLANEAKVKCCKWKSGDLRKNPTFRNEIAKEAGKILNSMRGMI